MRAPLRLFLVVCLAASTPAGAGDAASMRHPNCRRVEQDARAAAAAEAQLERLSPRQLRLGEHCRVEKTMLEADADMIDLIEQTPGHCGHTPAGLALMRASQRTMIAIGC